MLTWRTLGATIGMRDLNSYNPPCQKLYSASFSHKFAYNTIKFKQSVGIYASGTTEGEARQLALCMTVTSFI